MEYEISWLDDNCDLLATTNGEFDTLLDAIKFAYGAAQREDGEGATQVTILLKS